MPAKRSQPPTLDEACDTPSEPSWLPDTMDPAIQSFASRTTTPDPARAFQTDGVAFIRYMCPGGTRLECPIWITMLFRIGDVDYRTAG
jgi:hypothetical protein